MSTATYTFITGCLFCTVSLQLNRFFNTLFNGIIFLLSTTIVTTFHKMLTDMQSLQTQIKTLNQKPQKCMPVCL